MYNRARQYNIWAQGNHNRRESAERLEGARRASGRDGRVGRDEGVMAGVMCGFSCQNEMHV